MVFLFLPKFSDRRESEETCGLFHPAKASRSLNLDPSFSPAHLLSPNLPKCLLLTKVGSFKPYAKIKPVKFLFLNWSIPETWFTLYTGDILYTFSNPKGSSTGSTLFD